MHSRFLKNETFEYMRLDKEYRYMSEQVSHHPPISACWAESPNWHYFGEVRVRHWEDPTELIAM